MRFAQDERERRALAFAVVFVTALIVRLLVWDQLSDSAFGRRPFLDAAYYDAAAERMAAGDWLGGHTPFFVEPGYLYLLAFAKWLGADIVAIRLVQAVVGALTALLAASIGLRLGGGNAAAGVAGLLVALYAPLVHFEGLLLKTTLEVFLATLALTVALAPRPRPLRLGLVAGAALMLKSNFLLMVPVLMFWTWRRQPRDARSRARAPVWVALGVLPFLLATGVRNWVVSGEALVLPWSSGINFYIGNGPEADGLDPTLPFAHSGAAGEGLAGKQEAERRAGRPLGHAESSAFWWSETWHHIAGSPRRFVALLIDKTRLFLHAYEYTDNVSLYFVRERVRLLGWLPFGYWIVVPLALAGMLGAVLKRDPPRLLIAGFLTLHAAGVIAFHVVDRYRLAAVPSAVALGVVALLEAFRQDRTYRTWIGGALIVGVLVAVVLPGPLAGTHQSFAGHHRMLGIEAMSRGDYVTAERELARATELNPRVALYHLRLAAVRHMLGDATGAELALADGLRLDPDEGLRRYGALLLQDDPVETARVCLLAASLGQGEIESLHCAGVALSRAGRLERAEEVLQDAAGRAPGVIDLWIALADVRELRGDDAGARSAKRRARALEKQPRRWTLDGLEAFTPDE